MRVLPVLLVLIACGGADPERPPPEVTATSGGEVPQETAAEAPPPNAAGSSFENPAPTCGAGEGYAMVASYRCPDGSMPLGGEAHRGAQSRVGSMRSHLEGASTSPLDSHIVDHYRVECPSGPVDVYVCMYHCPAGRTAYD